MGKWYDAVKFLPDLSGPSPLRDVARLLDEYEAIHLANERRIFYGVPESYRMFGAINMKAVEWQASNDPAAMLRLLTRQWAWQPSDRKLRLFACACLRSLPSDIIGEEHEGVLRACAMAERYADGEVTLYAMLEKGGPRKRREYVCEDDARYAAERFVDSMHPGYDGRLRAGLLRDIFGNPFDNRLQVRWGRCHEHADGAAPREVRWISPLVLNIARGIYFDRDFTRMPVLWDALEEAGCTDETIRRHCQGVERCYQTHVVGEDGVEKCSWDGCGVDRKKGPSKATGWAPLRAPHTLGCWVIDLILGKE